MPRQAERLNLAFGSHLRHVREAASLTQTEVGRRIGLSRTSITNIEQGYQTVTLTVLYRLADALGCDPASLLTPSPGTTAALDAALTLGLPTKDKAFVARMISDSRERREKAS